METRIAKKYFRAYAPGVAYIEIRDSSGHVSIGSAYHIGKGYFVTAKHIFSSNTSIISIGTMVDRDLNENDPKYGFKYMAGKLKMLGDPTLHPSSQFDLAIFQTSRTDLPVIPLDPNIEKIPPSENLLSEVLIMGYPPIPFSRDPELVTFKSSIISIINRYDKINYYNYILSTIARGGYSGGLPLHEDGYSLGVITESLLLNNLPPELGYLAVLSCEPIYELKLTIGI